MFGGGTTTSIIQVAKAAISKTTTTWATIATIRTVHLQADRVIQAVVVVQAVAAVVQAVAAVVQIVAAVVQVVAAGVQAAAVEVQAAAVEVQAAAVEVQAAVAVVEGAAVAEGDVEACSAFVFNLDVAGTLHSFVGREPECRGFSQIFVPLLDRSSKHFSFCV